MKLVVVGDVHGDWDADSEVALRFLQPDAVLIVGDIGNEDVFLVTRLAALNFSKAFILGNHDAWFSLTQRGRDAYAQSMARSTLGMLASGPDAYRSPSVRAQLEVLGDSHVGYASTSLVGGRLSVVGARPFSKGGHLKQDVWEFYEQHYGVRNLEESADRIVGAVLRQQEGQGPSPPPLVVLAHNGPTGLGQVHHSPCGVDWTPESGDHGDADLEDAMNQLHGLGHPPCLVVYGHMHHKLNQRGAQQASATLRDRVSVRRGTVYLNAAVVPRIRRAGRADEATHHFLEVEVDEEGRVFAAADAHVTVHRGGETAPVAERSALLATSLADGRLQTRILRCHTGAWEVVVDGESS